MKALRVRRLHKSTHWVTNEKQTLVILNYGFFNAIVENEKLRCSLSYGGFENCTYKKCTL